MTLKYTQGLVELRSPFPEHVGVGMVQDVPEERLDCPKHKCLSSGHEREHVQHLEVRERVEQRGSRHADLI